jgi:hypothetical protein
MRMYSNGFIPIFFMVTHARGRPRAQRSQIRNAVVSSPAIPPTNLIASSIFSDHRDWSGRGSSLRRYLSFPDLMFW